MCTLTSAATDIGGSTTPAAGTSWPTALTSSPASATLSAPAQPAASACSCGARWRTETSRSAPGSCGARVLWRQGTRQGPVALPWLCAGAAACSSGRSPRPHRQCRIPRCLPACLPQVHRALAGPILYTDVHVGEGSRAMECGGPPTSGPNTLGYTTYWSVRSNRPISPARGSSIYRPPGECDFGAVSEEGRRAWVGSRMSSCRSAP